MRWYRVEGVLKGAGVAGVAGASVLAIIPAAEAAGLSFPTEQALVPVAVGAAFALPALVALAFFMLSRMGRVIGPIVGISTVALVVIAVAGYLHPGLLPVPGS